MYSLYSPAFGEAMPPQVSDKNVWVDEVFQPVAVQPGKEGGWFIHGAGTYNKDPGIIDPGKLPFWNPSLGSYCNGDTCVFMTWAQQAHLPTKYKSALMNYLVYKNCGDGVMETVTVMHVFDNYGVSPDETKITYLNSPWVGLRLTTFREALISKKELGGLDYNQNFPPPLFGERYVKKLYQTDGYITYAQDLPLPQPKESNTPILPCYRWKRTCETECSCSCADPSLNTVVCTNTCDTGKDQECDTKCHEQETQTCSKPNGQTCPIRCLTECTDPELEYENECTPDFMKSAVPPYQQLEFVIQDDNSAAGTEKQQVLWTHDGNCVPS